MGLDYGYRKGYRTRIEIARDILVAAGVEGSRKTHIMYRANLSYRLLNRYLKHVLKAGLIECDGKNCYVVTDAGKAFIEMYDEYEKTSKKVEKGMIYLRNDREKLEKMLI